MIISFSGTSGSGKSTIIVQILKSGIFEGKKVIVREEDSFISIKILKHILGENIFSKYKEEKYFKKSYNDIFYRFFVALCYIFYPIAVYIEFLIDYIWYQIIFKKTLLIVDKFIYDHAVNFKNILGIDNKFVRWLINLFPRPYLAFLIDINLSTALLRNKNNIPGKITSNSNRLFHKNVLNHYRKIAKRHNLLIIDNNGDLKDTVKNISSYVINKEKLLNARKIAICGLDGVGKTTIANMLAEYATSLNIKCKIIHFIHNNLLYKLLLLLGYYKIDGPKKFLYKRSREHSARERLQKTSFIKAFLRFFDSYVQYLFYINLNRNKLIIFDRYFYDYLVSFEYLNIKWRSFFSKLVPEIKNKFLFQVSPMVSYRRKPERVKAFFVECHQIYLRVAKEQNIKIINTENKNPNYALQQLLGNIEY